MDTAVEPMASCSIWIPDDLVNQRGTAAAGEQDQQDREEPRSVGGGARRGTGGGGGLGDLNLLRHKGNSRPMSMAQIRAPGQLSILSGRDMRAEGWHGLMDI